MFGVGTFGGSAGAGVVGISCDYYLYDTNLYLLCIGGPAITATPGEVQQGGTVTVTLTGWKPGSQVEVSVVTQDGQTIIIGMADIGPDGVGEIVWNVPADFPPGPVTIVGNGLSMLDVASTREAAVVVLGASTSASSTPGTGDQGTGNLPVTGNDSGFLVGIGAALIVVGAAAVYGATRGRRQEL